MRHSEVICRACAECPVCQMGVSRVEVDVTCVPVVGMPGACRNAFRVINDTPSLVDNHIMNDLFYIVNTAEREPASNGSTTRWKPILYRMKCLTHVARIESSIVGSQRRWTVNKKRKLANLVDLNLRYIISHINESVRRFIRYSIGMEIEAPQSWFPTTGHRDLSTILNIPSKKPLVPVQKQHPPSRSIQKIQMISSRQSNPASCALPHDLGR
ncbi:hypothetical protein B0J11DRAFT_71856 [Dendryphion nanum]|uniref:Uncharacterized protein n=1 Tax=Dendryphion nanum TaxID=256645 RepID=A0A9P9IFF6_9PLEO|nr:hypothetical protein B0J11DRAFT_71856 [Dendryphion nanum]